MRRMTWLLFGAMIVAVGAGLLARLSPVDSSTEDHWGAPEAPGFTASADEAHLVEATDAFATTVDTPAELRALVRACRQADRKDIERLQELARSSDPLVAGNALRALGRLGVDVSDFVDDPRRRVRQAAIAALGDAGNSASVDRLADLALAEDSTTRALAIRSLGLLATKRARARLEALSDSGALGAVDAAFVRAALRDMSRD